MAKIKNKCICIKISVILILKYLLFSTKTPCFYEISVGSSSLSNVSKGELLLKRLLHSHVIGGLGIIVEMSCDQYKGTDPLTCT